MTHIICDAHGCSEPAALNPESVRAYGLAQTVTALHFPMDPDTAYHFCVRHLPLYRHFLQEITSGKDPGRT